MTFALSGLSETAREYARRYRTSARTGTAPPGVAHAATEDTCCRKENVSSHEMKSFEED